MLVTNDNAAADTANDIVGAEIGNNNVAIALHIYTCAVQVHKKNHLPFQLLTWCKSLNRSCH